MDSGKHGDFFQKITRNRLQQLIFAFIVLTAMGLACRLPGVVDQPDDGVGNVETRVAQTMEAREGGEGVEDTATPAPPTDTDTPELTDTPTLSPTTTFTPTPEIVSVHVTGNTFCRTGPGSVYDQRGVFSTDQESEIIAKDPSGSFWYIINPDNTEEKCWIWGEYATPEGPTAGLPVYTPPPTPTPFISFSVSFREMDACVQDWLEFTVVNNGTVPLESFSISTTDTDTGKSWGPDSYNVFEAWNSCEVGTSHSSVAPGDTTYIMTQQLTTMDYDPKGQPFTVTIKVCSQDNLNGMCLTRNVSVTAPDGS